MANFQNTEQVYSTSGVSNTWLAANPAFDQIRNSGGIVNVSGRLLIKDIIVQPASGRWADASTSGVVLAVNHATSGMFAQLSGQQLFRYDAGAQSGLATGNTTFVPGSPRGMNFIARSGIVTLNSGTHVYDIIVTYATPQN